MTSQRLSELRHKGYITEEEYQELKTNPGKKERYISETNKILNEIRADIDNLDVYTIYMGASQPDKVCIEYKEIVRIITKYRLMKGT